MRPTRRQLLGAVGAGLVLPQFARAASADERVFLFFYVEGGWDPAFVFTPLLGTSAYQESGATEATFGAHTIVDHPDRLAVRFFFENHTDDICLIHGMEVPSITHERCVRLLLTGATGGAADWPTRLAGTGVAMPHLVLDGPVFPGDLPERVVRVGDQNQLSRLLEGQLGPYDEGLTPPPQDVQALVDAHVRARAEAASGEHASRYASSLAGLERLQAEAAGLDFASQSPGCTRDFPADFEVIFDAFEAGMSRCVMLRHQGWCNQGWDTHQLLQGQSDNFEDLFNTLFQLQDALNSRPALAERLVLIVASEMGRHPKLNAWGGKDHWTWTSAMLMGSGVRGGSVIGGLDDQGRGRSVDLMTGETSEGGTALGPEHLGATLLSLGGVEGGDAAPILAALED